MKMAALIAPVNCYGAGVRIIVATVGINEGIFGQSLREINFFTGSTLYH
jgi:hypothetical protein